MKNNSPGPAPRAARRRPDSKLAKPRKPRGDASASAASSHPGVSASMLAICRAIGSNLDLSSVLETIVAVTAEEMRAQQCSILLYEQGGDQLRMIASQGLPDDVVARGYLPRKGSIAEWVIDNNSPMVLNGAVGGKSYFSASSNRAIVSSMCVPLRARGAALGTINLNRTDESLGPFTDADLDVMTILASQAAVSIENSQLHEDKLRAERLAAIGETVSGVAHCMKNLLTSLRGGASVCELARRRGDWTLHDDGFAIMQRGLARVSTLALNMLDYCKDREPASQWLRLDDLAGDLAALKAGPARDREISIELDIQPAAADAYADADLLFRCLLNLLENALDASPEGGRVAISAALDASPEALARLREPAPAATVIRVSDSGHGVEPEIAERIFDPFFSTKGSKGTGLGLAVTRKIIREHGGELELVSRAGAPAEFAIYLPCPAA